jgi:hypothetical protein
VDGAEGALPNPGLVEPPSPGFGVAPKPELFGAADPRPGVPDEAAPNRAAFAYSCSIRGS